MRKWLWVTLVIAAFGLAGCGSEQWRDHQGEAVARTGLQGNWVVVNYWAEWCAPCLHELPEFNRLAAARPDIRVFGVNYDGVSGEELRELSDRMGIDRKSTRLNSSHVRISYAVFCLKKKTKHETT